MTLKFDIAIVGSGLTGTVASLTFAQLGYKVALIDPISFSELKSQNYDTRTTALSKKAKSFLDNIKLWKQIKPHTCMIKNILVNDGTSSENIFFKKLEKSSSSNALGYMIKNKLLSKVLIKAVLKTNNIIKFDTKVKSFFRESKVVSLNLDNKIKIICNLLIGADGKNSFIRKMAGISFKKKCYKQKAFIFNVKHQKSHNYLATENFLEQGPLASLPIIHNASNLYSSIVWSCNHPFYFKIMKFEKSEIEHILNKYLSDFYGKFKIISEIKNWDLSLIKADKYFDHRLLLLGDSAHSIHPLAGQGFNLTLRGIENLYKIAKDNRVKRDELGNFKNLRLYNNKQYIDSLSIIFATDKLNFLFSNSNFFLKNVRKIGLFAFNRSKLLKNFFKNYASEGRISVK